MMRKLRVGFDTDGVHANWTERVTSIAHSLNPVFPVIKVETPRKSWNLEDDYFGGKEFYHDGRLIDMDLVKEVFDTIPHVWETIKPINVADLQWLSAFQQANRADVDLLIITARSGPKLSSEEIRRQTENWYSSYAVNPEVYVRYDKGAAASELEVDLFLDDHAFNVKSILEGSPQTKPYLLKRSYNMQDARNGLGHITLDAIADYHRIIEQAASDRAIQRRM